ncbi:amylosucrase [Arsukibacterium sp.]|uniref:amylosucrase n=1 Tax=Arsukibacterium sp. TaxID=1977258 RepID=UPI001BD32B1A|nr:amylosucrase [Arsukibacterium sp.]
MTPEQLQRESRKILKRLSKDLKRLSHDCWPDFHCRLQTYLPDLLALYLPLYQSRYDCYYYLEQLLRQLATSYRQRPTWQKQADQQHLQQPQWFASEHMLGGACYVDLFGGDLAGLKKRIPYFQQLGLTYLHLMPLFTAPEHNSDGGYAVSDYRTVTPQLGNMAQLAELAQALKQAGISLVLDFVFNHTSDEHQWAQRAKQGDTDYQDFYFIFDQQQKAEFEPQLREIFPQIRRGCFTYEPTLNAYVWTTFNSFQWDLNYANPAVFNAMAAEMLFLANQGVQILRLDALAFVWKEAGTSCENLDKAHTIIQAFNTVARIAAPGLLFKSEAIVHPDEVVKYISPQECQLSYNPLLMAMLWNSLATRKVRLMTESLKRKFAISEQCSWVNYIRCHDDIGWTFDDNVAWQLGINPTDHRQFLNQFYTGNFAGSFASGVPFAENPETGDCRVAGMLASLVGLEQALENNDRLGEQRAIERIMLLHSIIFSIGGIPLLYLGDELGVLNDYSYSDDPAKKDDSRWVNRVAVSDTTLLKAGQADTISGKVFQGLQQLLQVRRQLPLLATARTEFYDSGSPHVFCYKRQQASDSLLVLANFSEQQQSVVLNNLPFAAEGNYFDCLGQQSYSSETAVSLTAYQVLWLQASCQQDKAP